MNYPSLTERLLEAVDRYQCPRAQMRKVGNRWEAIPAAEMLRRIAGLSRALAELGIQAGDRVGVFAPNLPEWHIADYAILGLGAVNVPVYFNEAPDRIVYILNHSGAKAVVVAGAEQARRLLGCRARLPGMGRIIVVDAPPELDGDILRYEPLIATTSPREVEDYRRRAAEVR
ncbi:MAG TPA: AMP-binding protein, partial [Candidatus Acidoferrales bacterium]|nr:AMP-binding protein [Candidatus Acidoferrales bacterium]